MNEVKWIKIVTDIFDDDKILLIESLPAADTIIVIWFKLLCLAGKQNNSGVFIFNDKIAYNEDMLSTIFRRDKNTVKLALDTFENFGMIERIEGVITIPNWNKHQTLDSYELKKIRDRQYQTQRREKQRKLIEKSSDKSSDKERLIAQPSDDESLPVAFSEEERERDIDIEIDKEKNIKKESSELKPQTDISAPYKDAFAEFSGENTELLKAFRDFEKMRKKLRKPLSDEAKKRLVKKLKSLSEDPNIQIKILNQSEDNCWLSVFALKHDTKPLKHEYSSAELDFIKKLEDKYSV